MHGFRERRWVQGRVQGQDLLGQVGNSCAERRAALSRWAKMVVDLELNAQTVVVLRRSGTAG